MKDLATIYMLQILFSKIFPVTYLNKLKQYIKRKLNLCLSIFNEMRYYFVVQRACIARKFKLQGVSWPEPFDIIKSSHVLQSTLRYKRDVKSVPSS